MMYLPEHAPARAGTFRLFHPGPAIFGPYRRKSRVVMILRRVVGIFR